MADFGAPRASWVAPWGLEPPAGPAPTASGLPRAPQAAHHGSEFWAEWHLIEFEALQAPPAAGWDSQTWAERALTIFGISGTPPAARRAPLTPAVQDWPEFGAFRALQAALWDLQHSAETTSLVGTTWSPLKQPPKLQKLIGLAPSPSAPPPPDRWHLSTWAGQASKPAGPPLDQCENLQNWAGSARI